MLARKCIIALAFSLGLAGAALAQDPPPADDPIIAKVGDKVVTQSEVQSASERAARVMQNGHGGGAPLDRERVISTCIDAKILEIVVEKSGVTISDEEIDQFAEEAQKQRPGAGSFDDFLKRQNLTREQYRERARPNLLLAKFLEPKLREVRPTEEEIRAEYDRAKSAGQLEKPETVDVSQIVIRVPAGSEESVWDEAKKKIEAARKRIVEGGEDFATVAKEVSDDPTVQRTSGALVNVRKGGVPPEFEKAAFGTEVGETSEPFRASYGWQFLKVIAKRAAGTATLDEAAPMIMDVLMQQRREEVVRKVIEEAKKDIKIERLDVSSTPPPSEAPGDEKLIESAT